MTKNFFVIEVIMEAAKKTRILRFNTFLKHSENLQTFFKISEKHLKSTYSGK